LESSCGHRISEIGVVCRTIHGDATASLRSAQGQIKQFVSGLITGGAVLGAEKKINGRGQATLAQASAVDDSYTSLDFLVCASNVNICHESFEQASEGADPTGHGARGQGDECVDVLPAGTAKHSFFA